MLYAILKYLEKRAERRMKRHELMSPRYYRIVECVYDPETGKVETTDTTVRPIAFRDFFISTDGAPIFADTIGEVTVLGYHGDPEEQPGRVTGMYVVPDHLSHTADNAKMHIISKLKAFVNRERDHWIKAAEALSKE